MNSRNDEKIQSAVTSPEKMKPSAKVNRGSQTPLSESWNENRNFRISHAVSELEEQVSK